MYWLHFLMKGFIISLVVNNISVVQMGSLNALYSVTKDWRCKNISSFRYNTIVLFTLLSTLFRCSWKINLISTYILICFLERTYLKGVLIEINLIMICFLKLSWKYNLLSLCSKIELKFIFHWIVQFLVLFRSLFKLIVDVFILWTIEKSEVSTAKSLTFIVKSSDTLALILVHEEYWSFKQLCFLKFKKSVMISNSIPEIPFCFSLSKSPLCHTLSNTFGMSKNIPRTSRPSRY